MARSIDSVQEKADFLVGFNVVDKRHVSGRKI
jgi:hypothetical protein